MKRCRPTDSQTTEHGRNGAMGTLAVRALTHHSIAPVIPIPLTHGR